MRRLLPLLCLLLATHSGLATRETPALAAPRAIGVGLQSGGVNPLTILGHTALVLWLRCDQGITLNSGNVSAWADLSGHGNNVAQAIASEQPPYVAGAPAQCQVTYPKNGNFYNLFGGSLSSLTQPFTIFLVGGLNSGASNAVPFGMASSAGATHPFETDVLSTTNLLMEITSSITKTAPTAYPFVFQTYWNGASSSISFNNGSATTGNVGSSSVTPTGQIEVGNLNAAGLVMNGYIAEFLVVEGTVVNPQLAGLTNYFQTTYGQP
jgi:hypothetical protein